MKNYTFGPASEAATSILQHADPSVNLMELKHTMLVDLGIAPAEEAIKAVPGTSAGRAKLVNLLFKDVILRKNTDFGTIPASRGNIADFSYYETMCACMAKINANGHIADDPNVIRMNALHEALVSERASFEYGFKLNIDVIVYTYCTLVAAFMDIIQVNIVLFAKDFNGEPLRQTNRSNYKVITSSVDSFLDMRKRGDWKRLMDSYRKSYSKNAIGTVGTVIIVSAASAVGVVALVNMIRNLIFLYYNAAVNIDEKARAMEAYLNEVMPYETNEKALNKQKKMATRMASLAGTIETNILKDTTKAEAELSKVDKNISIDAYAPSQVSPDEDANYSGITFM